MNHGVKVSDGDVDTPSLAELTEVNPVVLLFLQLETVIKLVHLNVVGEVPLQDLSDEPAVAQVALGIGDLVG